MGLLGNNALTTFGAIRVWGGREAFALGSLDMPGNWRNWTRQDLAAITLSLAARPVGEKPEQAWFSALTAGEMHAYTTSGTGFIGYSNLAGGYAIGATLSGSGDVSQALLGLIVSLTAQVTGAGDLSNSLLNAQALCSAVVAGSGDLEVAGREALGWIIAALTGTSTTTGSILAKGFLEAEVNVTGELLTSANVAEYVWEFLIENGLTAHDAVKLMSAALAGELSGAGSSQITIKSAVSGTKDRIIADVDGSGNRTSITVDLTD